VNVVLGVSGSVAAYRAADLARDLMRAGCTVRVCLTDAANQFVSASLFEALTGQPCLQSVFEEPTRGRMAHIDWARQAQLLIVAPATASTLAKLAHGVADDMLSTIALAYSGPILVAPAMNPAMYANEATQSALEILRQRGVCVVEPIEGDVACGEHGQGKLAANGRISSEAMVLLRMSTLLAGKRVVITSGPTQEPIDAVRFLSNRSSGKMGAALALAAMRMGGDVTVISGPARAVLPHGVKVEFVRTAREMLAAALPAAQGADLVIGAAAVADYRPATQSQGKLRRSSETIQLELTPNPDVIAEMAKATPGARVVGFAAEPSIEPAVAMAKLAAKGLFAIAANDILQMGTGFDADDNALTLIYADGRTEESGLRSKLNCAAWLLERIAR
jgi:phosphopantothenoylcysteine decarboxylase/phosphopantothenate--cysteine ligase